MISNLIRYIQRLCEKTKLWTIINYFFKNVNCHGLLVENFIFVKIFLRSLKNHIIRYIQRLCEKRIKLEKNTFNLVLHCYCFGVALEK